MCLSVISSSCQSSDKMGEEPFKRVQQTCNDTTNNANKRTKENDIRHLCCGGTLSDADISNPRLS